MKTAMILAAGRGERLKPLTDNIPKALCLVHGMPLIEHHVRNLVKAGFTHLVINHAYLGSQIRHHLGDGSRFNVQISYSPEPPGGLETGGGIVNALPLLGECPFITVNADIYTDFDFSDLPLSTVSYAHLVLVKNNPLLGHSGDYGLTTGHRLTNNNCEFTFSGIACYTPLFFSLCSQGRYSVTQWVRHYAEQSLVTASLYEGMWFDIGSAERLKAVND